MSSNREKFYLAAAGLYNSLAELWQNSIEKTCSLYVVRLYS